MVENGSCCGGDENENGSCCSSSKSGNESCCGSSGEKSNTCDNNSSGKEERNRVKEYAVATLVAFSAILISRIALKIFYSNK